MKGAVVHLHIGRDTFVYARVTQETAGGAFMVEQIRPPPVRPYYLTRESLRPVAATAEGPRCVACGLIFI